MSMIPGVRAVALPDMGTGMEVAYCVRCRGLREIRLIYRAA